MKKFIMGIGIAAMVMGMTASANAWIIKGECKDPTTLTGTSLLQLSNEQNVFTALAGAAGAEATVAVYKNNDNSVDLTNAANQLVYGGAVLKIAPTMPDTIYGIVVARAGYTGTFDLRFFSTTNTSKLASGDWYLYKGQTEKSQATLLDTAKFSTTESTWATSTFGSVFKNGDTFMLSTVAVPEPGSMVAMLSGLAGLVGFGIRRRK